MATNAIVLRKATVTDLPELKNLFRETILGICINEYDDEQRKVWAASSEKIKRWRDLINDQIVFVAVKDATITGFASLLHANYIDFMYVHKDYQRQGIAETLLQALEEEAIKQNAVVITSDISKTARPFFEKKGYTVIKEQENIRGNVILVNYKMKKEL